MPSTLLTRSMARDGTALVLPRWRLADNDDEIILYTGLTTLTYTIREVEADAVIGSADVDGKPDSAGGTKNGVTVESDGRVAHALTSTNNTMADSTLQQERRQVEYTWVSGSETYKRVVEYVVVP